MKYILDLMLKKISKDDFLKLNGIKRDQLSEKIFSNISEAAKNKSAHDLELAVYLIFEYDVYRQDLIEVLNKLLADNWHEQHENIAMLLQEYNSSSSIPYLVQTIKTEHDYLKYDTNFALAVKCIWALGDIGNDDAKKQLSELVSSDNKIISENAKKQIERLTVKP